MNHDTLNPSSTPEPVINLAGYLAGFDDVASLLEAAEKVRDAGFSHWDCHTPFPVHGLNDAMGLRATRLPYFVSACGVAGLSLALLMQWWMNAIDYPFLISGKPLFSLPANIPIIFELTVLLSAFGVFFGMLGFNRLPRYHHPVFSSETFKAATSDKFFISIESGDPKFDEQKTLALLESLGGFGVERLEDEE